MIEKKIIDLYTSFDNKKITDSLQIKGWIKNNRSNNLIGFIEFNDGSYFKNIQVVYKNKINDFDKISKLIIGTAICVIGKYVETPNNKQPFEILAEKIELISKCDNDYPLQKKKHNFEFLREISHLRARTNIFNAVNRVRNSLFMAIHTFFQENNFIWVNTPIITSNDAEGAGNTFKVTTENEKNEATDFFGKPVCLTVSGQLHVEAFALTFGNVYTFGPTFRAERSHTTSHACEFWMIEPEMAFCDLNENMILIEKVLKFCINYVLKNCENELLFLNNLKPGLLEKNNNFLKNEIKKIEYSDAIEILQKAIKSGVNFDNKDIYWGMDFKKEHEKYITERVVKGPVFIINYPKEIKSFYMRLNDDNKTVAACDLIVPEIGELIGGSQREERYEFLKNRMEEIGNLNDLNWYLDLRKYGCCYHSGFGIGFDRLLMFITGIENVRDVQPFPRTYNNIKF